MAKKTAPILYRWTEHCPTCGGTYLHFAPMNAAMLERSAKAWTIDEVYRLEFLEGRSEKSHNAYFASLAHIWTNLPHNKQAEYPTVEHMRKRALIVAGYADMDYRTFDTPEDAEKCASLMRPREEFAVITVKGCVVRVYTAQSQSRSEMPEKGQFEASKRAVLEITSGIIGLTPDKVMAQVKGEPPPDEGDHYRYEPDLPEPATVPPAEAAAPAIPAPATGGPIPTATGPVELGHNEAGDPKQPRNYAQYLVYLGAWLPVYRSQSGITKRLADERKTLWPTFTPPLTATEIATIEELAMKRIRAL